MARLFVGPRELDFINDIGKEFTKDIIAQEIIYYPISFVKSDVHPVYEEATKKVFENPIRISAKVDWQPSEVTTTKFGQESIAMIDVTIQSRDLIQREIIPKDGDFFTYGSQTFEVTKVTGSRSIFGQIEYSDGTIITGKETRKDVFSTKILGPTDEYYTDDDSVLKDFKQQRGLVEGDKRDLVDNEVLDAPIVDTPTEVSQKAPAGKKGRSGFFDPDGDC